LVPPENPAGTVYGVIMVGALLAAESGRHETYLETEASAVIAAGLYWLAHGYATVLGRRLTTGERLTGAALWRGLVHDGTLLRGAAIPLAVIPIAWVTGASQASAVSAALWSVVASLVVFEIAAGMRSHLTRGELVFEAGVGVTLGIGILALRIVLH
jgi:hypothetical protein